MFSAEQVMIQQHQYMRSDIDDHSVGTHNPRTVEVEKAETSASLDEVTLLRA